MQRDSTAGRNEETRECRSCLATGWVMVDVAYDPSTGELTEEAARCPICKGAGTVSIFLYAHARSSR